MKARPWHLLTEPILPKSIAEKRYNLCRECPELVHVTKQCKKCLCIMPVKVRVPSAECPLNKWGKEIEVE
jgi:hypothetical protein